MFANLFVFIYLSVCLPTWLCVYLLVCVFAYLSECLFTCLCVCLSTIEAAVVDRTREEDLASRGLEISRSKEQDLADS